MPYRKIKSTQAVMAAYNKLKDSNGHVNSWDMLPEFLGANTDLSKADFARALERLVNDKVLQRQGTSVTRYG
ncbi:hypothetical protein NXC24_PB00424 (plasmid) [Rhizobium sp. NXC24]|nr:hypothetical protein NXC24_PB00424 [Rhizobium sp. NXC24]